MDVISPFFVFCLTQLTLLTLRHGVICEHHEQGFDFADISLLGRHTGHPDRETL
jgi:hypothetical protein